MTTQEFYNLAVMAAKEKGIEKPNISTISGCYNGAIKHSCQVFIAAKRKHIYSGLHNNPVSAILAFKDAIEFEFKEYSTMQEDIEIEKNIPCSEQWHELSLNMGDGVCSKCAKVLTNV